MNAVLKYLNKKKNDIISDKYLLLVILIVIFAVILRVYNFSNRWGLGSDDVRDILIAQEALARFELPLIGSFSSAGPFMFGPLFYWFIMISYILIPFTLKAPWILLTLSGIVSVYILIYSGKLLGGNRLGIMVGLLAASSPQLVNRSIALNQHSLIALTGSLLILFFILFWKKKKLRYAFLMGISLGIAFGMHYQAINLFIFFPAILLVPKISFRNKMQALLLMFLGFLIPSGPHLLWDFRQNFANIRNILDYLLISQHRLYVPNSWKLFLFDYLPNYWLFVSGGLYLVGLLSMFFIATTLLFKTVIKKINGLTIVLGGIFFLLLLVNRFYKGERFEGYLMYLAPFIILFTGWVINQLFAFKNRIGKLVGYTALFIIVIGNLALTKNHILTAQNREKEIRRIENTLLIKYPNQKFSLYDYEWGNSDKSYPLSAFLKEKNKTSINGRAIGIIKSSREKAFSNTTWVILSLDSEMIIDLHTDKFFSTTNKKWVSVNRESVYDDLMQWQKGRRLYSNFSLSKYILERIPIKF